ncbi:DinB family protein [Chryseobacterium sp. SNU WT5]|uniref:DinB family protein n=1 Tax=Chryseobacterium sp. SNU WT5 TaxID=2594269 RepID=UPI0011807104|nr:DinB family protein [Chryseobacterium sp. SNU WT5]QDP86487.1 DinB family protein [Chryseobacterium sp. SNU WT5]
MQDVFNAQEAQHFIDRINKLTPFAIPAWGKMTVDQMLAHCNVTYEMVYEPQKHKAPGGIAKFILKKFVKPKVVGEKGYSKNSPTAPQFLIKERQDYILEKKRLIGFIQKTQQLGREAFDGKESFSFGKLKAQEWNNMFAKHLNHHLEQFGV